MRLSRAAAGAGDEAVLLCALPVSCARYYISCGGGAAASFVFQRHVWTSAAPHLLTHQPLSPAVRGDVPKGTAEIFFRKVKFWKGEAPPVFVSGGNAASRDGVAG